VHACSVTAFPANNKFMVRKARHAVSENLSEGVSHWNGYRAPNCCVPATHLAP